MCGREKDKGRILDQVVEVTRWTRDNARRRLVAASKRPPGRGKRVSEEPDKPRSGKYSYGALKVLQRVWAASGGQCGKYLAVSMQTQLDGLERHGELVAGEGRYSPDGARRVVVDVCGIDRSLSQTREGHGPDQRRVDHEAVAIVALVDRDS